MRVAVVGTGYVGLVTGTCFSEIGHDVTCIDIDENKIRDLMEGIIPIYEPGLDEMVERNVSQGRLHFTTDLEHAIQNALVCIIAVGTPPLEDGTADLQYVLSVARGIGEAMNGYKIVVTKSTVPVGTARKVCSALDEVLTRRKVDFEYDVVSNPEFLREGSAIEDFMKPDRIVVGCDNGKARGIMEELYSSFARDGHPVLIMDTVSSEMTKYAANAMLATKISFINEVAGICERVGADVARVRQGIGADRRIGYQFINPGIGYGGSCFPKDVKALVSTARSAGHDPILLDAVESVNQRQKGRLFEKIAEYFDGDVMGRSFGVWGLSFKPETDDVREAPALVLIEALLKAGATVRAHDPEGMETAQSQWGEREGLEYCNDHFEALDGCDAMILVTEWAKFRNPDFETVKSRLKTPVVFDGRNIYSATVMRGNGFDYFAIGRKPVLAYSESAAALEAELRSTAAKPTAG